MTQDRSFRVLLTDRAWPDFDIERAILEDAGASVVEAPDQDEATSRIGSGTTNAGPGTI